MNVSWVEYLVGVSNQAKMGGKCRDDPKSVATDKIHYMPYDERKNVRDLVYGETKAEPDSDGRER